MSEDDIVLLTIRLLCGVEYEYDYYNFLSYSKKIISAYNLFITGYHHLFEKNLCR